MRKPTGQKTLLPQPDLDTIVIHSRRGTMEKAILPFLQKAGLQDRVEDVAQEAIRKAIVCLYGPNYQRPQYFIAWLKKIARNEAVNTLRIHIQKESIGGRKRRSLEAFIETFEGEIIEGKTPEALICPPTQEQDVEEFLFEKLLKRLTARQREIFILRSEYSPPTSYEEIAASYGVKQQAVRQMFLRTARKLWGWYISIDHKKADVAKCTKFTS